MATVDKVLKAQKFDFSKKKMSDELVELDFCCPECNCSQWQYDKDSGVYSCARCNYVVAFDEDDPDYDEEILDYDGDTGRAFIDGQWVVVSPQTWARWNGERN